MALGLTAGDRLPAERKLAVDLGLARPTLRRALAELGGRGLLETRHGAGTYVTQESSSDLLEVRLLIEPYAAGRAARISRTGDSVELLSVVDSMANAVGDSQAFAALDLKAHEIIANMSGNPLIPEILQGLQARLRRSRSKTAHSDILRQSTVATFRRLAYAIEHGDGASAEEAMRAHLTDVSRAASDPPPRPTTSTSWMLGPQAV